MTREGRTAAWMPETTRCLIVLSILAIIIVSSFGVPATPSAGGMHAFDNVKSEISKIFKVTLVTGDIVTVGITKENKTIVLAIEPYDPTKLNRGFRVFEDENGVYVLPNDIDIKKIDINLFNVKYLIEEGYSNYQTYSMITILNSEKLVEAQSFVKSTLENNKAGKIVRSFKIIPGASISLVPGKTFYDLMLSDYVIKIWLNYKVKVNLNESVPLIGAPSVWNIGYNGSGIKIAILDTGIDNTHPDFYFPNGTSKIKVNVDFTDDNNCSDFVGHGTHVASIAAGTGAASQGKFKGVAPGALLWNVKVLNRYGWGYWDWIIAGIEYAAYGSDKTPNTGDEADIISMSLGSSWTTDGTDPLSLACDAAADAGRVVVVAAGNYYHYFSIGTPAASRKAITVGASDKYDNIAWFSSKGPTVDFRIKPDLVAPGVDIIAARSSTGWFSPIPENSYYTQLSGTSMATPHVSGVAALLLQARATLFRQLPTSLIPLAVKNILICTSKDIGYDVYTQGGGRVNALAAVSTELIPDPATISLGRVAKNTTYNFVVTFYNVGTRNITISLTPRLYSIWYNYNATNNVKLNSTILLIPANGSRAVEVEVNTTLPAGYYSGVLTTNYTVGDSYVHAIFGFAVLNKIDVTFLGLDGSPLANAFVGAFKANATYQECEAWYPIWWIWSFTDSNGKTSFYTLDGIYYIVGNDIGKSNYASAYAINKTYIDKDVAITLNLRISHKVSYVPPAPNQVVAWLSDGIYYTYQNSTNWPNYRYSCFLISAVYYPASTVVYISSTDLLFCSYYQHYDKSYINVPDPRVLNAPELFSIPFAAKGIYNDITVSYSKSQLVRVVRDYRVALTPSVAALIWRSVYGWYYYGYDWDVWAPSIGFTITAPKRIVEYLSPTWFENIYLSYFVNYWKIRDQPNIVTPYFDLGGGGEHYHTPGNYSDAFNGHPFAPSISIDVWSGGSGNVASLWAWTDVFQNSHVYKNAWTTGGEDTIYWVEALWSDSGRLVIKRNGTVIFDSSSFYDMWGLYLDNIPLPAKFEFELYGQSNMWLSSSAFTKIEFEVPVNGSYWTWNPIWRIIVNDLDLNNTRLAGNITGYIVTNLNQPQPPTVTSVEYSVDDGATWKLAQVNSVSPYNFSFFLGNVPEYSYVSLRINLTNPKMSYTVLRAFYTTTPPDTTPPTVSVTHSPTTPSSFQTVTFTITAQDNPGGSGIAYVKLYVDGNLVQSWSSAGTFTYVGGPYPEGIHTYYAVAADAAGNVAQTGVGYFAVANIVTVVRGMDGAIYYKPCVSGCDYVKLATGATPDVPSAVYVDGKLFIAVRGMDNGIYVGRVDAIGSGSVVWQQVPGSTPSSPALTTDGVRLYLVVRGSDQYIYVNVYDMPSGQWLGWKRIEGLTSAAPAAAYLGGRLHLVVVGADGKLYHGQVDTTNFNVVWKQIDGYSDAGPSVATDGSRLYLAVKGLDSRIYVNTWFGAWSGWEAIPTGSTPSSPAIVYRPSTLYIFVRGNDDRIYYTFRLSPGQYGAWYLLDGLTPSAPAATPRA
jgi:subtilisin family serine protease